MKLKKTLKGDSYFEKKGQDGGIMPAVQPRSRGFDYPSTLGFYFLIIFPILALAGIWKDCVEVGHPLTIVKQTSDRFYYYSRVSQLGAVLTLFSGKKYHPWRICVLKFQPTEFKPASLEMKVDSILSSHLQTKSATVTLHGISFSEIIFNKSTFECVKS